MAPAQEREMVGQAILDHPGVWVRLAGEGRMAEMGRMQGQYTTPAPVQPRAHIISLRMAAMVGPEDREAREEPEGLEAKVATVGWGRAAGIVSSGPATGVTVTMAAKAATGGSGEPAATGGRMATVETSPCRSAKHSQARSISIRPVALGE